MEKRISGKSQESGTVEAESESRIGVDGTPGSVYGSVEDIRKIAAADARAPLDTEENMLLFLRSWWSRTYSRPLKDPLLETYSLEELLYEFFDHIERAKAAEESTERESDKIEEEKEKEVLDWAEQEERRELEELKRKGEASVQVDLSKDPQNIKWMEEQLKAHKEKFGEDFGEDVTLSLDE